MENYQSCCRLCLAPPHQENQDLFGKSCQEDLIPQKLLFLLSVLVHPQDTLPQKICSQCRDNVKRFFKFHRTSYLSTKHLLTFLENDNDERKNIYANLLKTFQTKNFSNVACNENYESYIKENFNEVTNSVNEMTSSFSRAKFARSSLNHLAQSNTSSSVHLLKHPRTHSNVNIAVVSPNELSKNAEESDLSDDITSSDSDVRKDSGRGVSHTEVKHVKIVAPKGTIKKTNILPEKTRIPANNVNNVNKIESLKIFRCKYCSSSYLNKKEILEHEITDHGTKTTVNLKKYYGPDTIKLEEDPENQIKKLSYPFRRSCISSVKTKNPPLASFQKPLNTTNTTTSPTNNNKSSLFNSLSFGTCRTSFKKRKAGPKSKINQTGKAALGNTVTNRKPGPKSQRTYTKEDGMSGNADNLSLAYRYSTITGTCSIQESRKPGPKSKIRSELTANASFQSPISDSPPSKKRRFESPLSRKKHASNNFKNNAHSSVRQRNCPKSKHVDNNKRVYFENQCKYCKCELASSSSKDFLKHLNVNECNSFTLQSCSLCRENVHGPIEKIEEHKKTCAMIKYFSRNIICGKCHMSIQAPNLVDHLLDDHKTLFKCFICSAEFNQKDCLSDHLRKCTFVPTIQRSFSCETCKENFKSLRSLKEHRLSIHTSQFLNDDLSLDYSSVFRRKEKKSSCFLQRYQIDSYIARNSEGAFFCGIKDCKKVLDTIFQLEAHIQTHCQKLKKKRRGRGSKKEKAKKTARVYECFKGISICDNESLRKKSKLAVPDVTEEYNMKPKDSFLLYLGLKFDHHKKCEPDTLLNEVDVYDTHKGDEGIFELSNNANTRDCLVGSISKEKRSTSPYVVTIDSDDD